MDILKLHNSGLKNGYRPIIWIKTVERERGMSYAFNCIDKSNSTVSGELEDIFSEVEKKTVYVNTPDMFLGSLKLNLKTSKQCSFDYYNDIKPDKKVDSPIKMLDKINSNENKNDYFILVEPMFFKNEMFLQMFLKEVSFKNTGTPIYVVSSQSPNDELAHLCYNVTLDGLTLAEIKSYLSKFDCDSEDKCAEALMGLTYIQMRQTIEYVRSNKEIKSSDIYKFKSENYDTSMLEVSHPNLKLEDLGGYSVFKKYVSDLPKFYTDKARQMKIKAPKGFIAFGVPGCSKTVSASLIASHLNVPLVNINLSKIMQGLVGASERNMELALNQVKELKQCVLLLDEAEKLFGGYQSSAQTDAGTLSRVMGRLLTFLHENENTFTVFTSNDITKLPPELLRAGRIDTQWYFNVPNKTEAKEILDIYLNKYSIELSKANDTYLQDRIDKFTGAEIEQAVINLQRAMFINDTEKVDKDIIDEALVTIVPVTRSSTDSIRMLEEHAKRFAVYASPKEDEVVETLKKPKIKATSKKEKEALNVFK